MVKAISPSASPAPTVVTTGSPATRVIQIGGNQRFVRPTIAVSQPQVTIRGQIRPPLSTSVVSTSGLMTNPIIVRTSSAPNNLPTAVWPSQPLTAMQLQDLFQRPRPPPPPPPATVVTSQSGVRVPTGQTIVRTILVPRAPAPQPIIQPQINTPLPNIQLPSEPVPISPQVRFFYREVHRTSFLL